MRTIPTPWRSSSGFGGHLPLKAATHRSDLLRRRFSNSSRCGCSEGISPFSEQIPHSFWIADDPPRTSFSYFTFRLPRRWEWCQARFLHLRVGRIITAECAGLSQAGSSNTRIAAWFQMVFDAIPGNSLPSGNARQTRREAIWRRSVSLRARCIS